MSFITRQSVCKSLQRSRSFSPAVLITPAFKPQLFTRALTYNHVRYNQVSAAKELAKDQENKEKLTKETVKQPTSRIGKFIQQSKELMVFYKNGIKLLWSNHKEAKALQLKIKNDGYELNRAEFQLVHRSKKDMLKLIPFGIVFFVLPESIPLLVIYAPGMVPSTCLKDNQIQKQREKVDKIRQKMVINVLKSAEQVQAITPGDFLSITRFQRVAKNYGFDFELGRIDKRHLSSYCRFMGLNDYGTRGIIKKRLEKYMDYLKNDDKLLIKEGIENLNSRELSHAVEERGMRSVDETEEQMRNGLNYWLKTSQADPSNRNITPGLLVFSRMFLLNAKF